MSNDNPSVNAVLDARGVLTLALNRPAARNAFDQPMVRCLTRHLSSAALDSTVRAVVVSGEGHHFCSGGDISWMRAVMAQPAEEMRSAAGEIAAMLESAYALPKPLMALVRGAAMGGGLGLACCADIVLADESARFGLGEVRIGILPALISPYLVRAIGQRQANSLALVAEPVAAAEAMRLGIVTHTCSPDEMTRVAERLLSSLLRGASDAQRKSKSLLRQVGVDKEIRRTVEHCTSEIVAAWQSQEAVEGMAAFLEKRQPSWLAQRQEGIAC